MSDHTGIEWTDATWNPVTGCTRVSPGCANCYIERTPPFRMNGRKFVRPIVGLKNGEPQRGPESTTGVRLHLDRLDQPLRWRKPRRVFVCSVADLFHDDVPDHFIDDVFAAMLAAPQHTFQVLTKRPERARDWFESYVSSFDTATRVWSIASDLLGATREHGGWPSEAWPLPNVWVGVSIENARYTWRADVLREIPAAVRFISAEPLLGSLFPPRDVLPDRPDPQLVGDPERRVELERRLAAVGRSRAPLDLAGIDWVIIGGESGPGARPFHLEHAREIVDAVGARYIEHGDAPAIFVKQLGAKPVLAPSEGAVLHDRKGGDWNEWPPDLRIREYPAAAKAAA